MTAHEHTLLGFWRVGAAELTEKDEKQDVDESMSMQKFASL